MSENFEKQIKNTNNFTDKCEEQESLAISENTDNETKSEFKDDGHNSSNSNNDQNQKFNEKITPDMEFFDSKQQTTITDNLEQKLDDNNETMKSKSSEEQELTSSLYSEVFNQQNDNQTVQTTSEILESSDFRSSTDECNITTSCSSRQGDEITAEKDHYSSSKQNDDLHMEDDPIISKSLSQCSNAQNLKQIHIDNQDVNRIRDMVQLTDESTDSEIDSAFNRQPVNSQNNNEFSTGHHTSSSQANRNQKSENDQDMNRTTPFNVTDTSTLKQTCLRNRLYHENLSKIPNLPFFDQLTSTPYRADHNRKKKVRRNHGHLTSPSSNLGDNDLNPTTSSEDSDGLLFTSTRYTVDTNSKKSSLSSGEETSSSEIHGIELASTAGRTDKGIISENIDDDDDHTQLSSGSSSSSTSIEKMDRTLKSSTSSSTSSATDDSAQTSSDSSSSTSSNSTNSSSGAQSDLQTSKGETQKSNVPEPIDLTMTSNSEHTDLETSDQFVTVSLPSSSPTSEHKENLSLESTDDHTPGSSFDEDIEQCPVIGKTTDVEDQELDPETTGLDQKSIDEAPLEKTATSLTSETVADQPVLEISDTSIDPQELINDNTEIAEVDENWYIDQFNNQPVDHTMDPVQSTKIVEEMSESSCSIPINQESLQKEECNDQNFIENRFYYLIPLTNHFVYGAYHWMNECDDLVVENAENYTCIDQSKTAEADQAGPCNAESPEVLEKITNSESVQQDNIQSADIPSSSPTLDKIVEELSSLIEDDCETRKNPVDTQPSNDAVVFDLENDEWMYQPDSSKIDQIVNELSNAVKDHIVETQEESSTPAVPADESQELDPNAQISSPHAIDNVEENTCETHTYDGINFYNIYPSPPFIEILLQEYSSSNADSTADKTEQERLSRSSSIVELRLDQNYLDNVDDRNLRYYIGNHEIYQERQTPSPKILDLSKSRDADQTIEPEKNYRKRPRIRRTNVQEQTKPTTSTLLPSQLLTRDDIEKLRRMFDAPSRPEYDVDRKRFKRRKRFDIRVTKPMYYRHDDKTPKYNILDEPERKVSNAKKSKRNRKKKYVPDNKRPKKKPKLDSPKKEKVKKPRALICPLVSEYFYNIETSGVDEADVQFSANYRGFRPTSSANYPEAVTMKTRILNVGKGSHNHVNLEIFGYCNFISSDHAVIFYNENMKTYELLNYSPFGTLVNDEVYGINVMIRRRNKRRKRSYPKSTTEKVYCKVLRNQSETFCKRRCFCDAEGVMNVTEDPVVVQHGAVLSFGCIPFVFSLLKRAKK